VYPIVSTLLPIAIDVKEVQSPKAQFPMDVTLFGTFNVVKEVHS
jgi:hypothetical protein